MKDTQTHKDTALSLAFKIGVKCRCPKCHESPIFRSYLKLHPLCPKCGLDFEPYDQGDGPAFFVMFGVGIIATPLALWLRSLTDMPLWLFIVFISIVTIALILALLPPTKGLLVSLQYKHDAAEGRLDHEGRGP